ncbi:MarR family winged helix-turn-helix transcriptional regulator [Krasilnikoviella flava]|uniref:DNA-binding transcriptional regulator, MarR family n=1 Tax=Krasilnikoviella flava TaxID=526729 RepID=A0A1T5ID05_9MICO|nr:MarR family transcriptional regulator [Krasilnikoviella flava]SKC37027.1 DNA-binding transcriptional regulator, MarR family [Krasilnikoviella flava]
MTASPGNNVEDERPDQGAGDATPEVIARVELGLAQLLRRAERTTAATTVRTGGHDLDRSGYLLLHALRDDGPQRVQALADRLGIDASTVTRQVVALERAGHVRRSRDPHDGRAVVVTATASGRDALRAQRRRRATTYTTVLAGWAPEDRTQLADLVERLNADLDAYKRDTPPA